MSLQKILGQVPVIPVLAIHDPDHAVPLARALAEGGLTILEVTLRTPVALEALRLIRDALPDITLGVGTVLQPEDMDRAANAGASFAVSPGLTKKLADAGRYSGIPLLPGVATVSEMMLARELGYRSLKFFPSGPMGGPAALKAIAPVMPDLAFCPTGGVTAANLTDYLALPNVFCVGGSWVAPDALVKAGDWKGISDLARKAVAAAGR